MADVDALERRVAALEAAQNDTTQTLRWVVSKLGTMAAVQSEHGLRLERIETEISAMRREMPGIVADALREVLKDR